MEDDFSIRFNGEKVTVTFHGPTIEPCVVWKPTTPEQFTHDERARRLLEQMD